MYALRYATWEYFEICGEGEQMEVMNEKEIKIVQNSTIYEIRLAFASGEKEEYKKEEILEMLDKIALAKE